MEFSCPFLLAEKSSDLSDPGSANPFSDSTTSAKRHMMSEFRKHEADNIINEMKVLHRLFSFCHRSCTLLL